MSSGGPRTKDAGDSIFPLRSCRTDGWMNGLNGCILQQRSSIKYLHTTPHHVPGLARYTWRGKVRMSGSSTEGESFCQQRAGAEADRLFLLSDVAAAATACIVYNLGLYCANTNDGFGEGSVTTVWSSDLPDSV